MNTDPTMNARTAAPAADGDADWLDAALAEDGQSHRERTSPTTASPRA